MFSYQYWSIILDKAAEIDTHKAKVEIYHLPATEEYLPLLQLLSY